MDCNTRDPDTKLPSFFFFSIEMIEFSKCSIKVIKEFLRFIIEVIKLDTFFLK